MFDRLEELTANRTHAQDRRVQDFHPRPLAQWQLRHQRGYESCIELTGISCAATHEHANAATSGAAGNDGAGEFTSEFLRWHGGIVPDSPARGHVRLAILPGPEGARMRCGRIRRAQGTDTHS